MGGGDVRHGGGSGQPETGMEPVEDSRFQRQKFIDAAREFGAETDVTIFRRIVRKVGDSPHREGQKGRSQAEGIADVLRAWCRDPSGTCRHPLGRWLLGDAQR